MTSWKEKKRTPEYWAQVREENAAKRTGDEAPVSKEDGRSKAWTRKIYDERNRVDDWEFQLPLRRQLQEMQKQKWATYRRQSSIPDSLRRMLEDGQERIKVVRVLYRMSISSDSVRETFHCYELEWPMWFNNAKVSGMTLSPPEVIAVLMTLGSILTEG